MLDHVGPWTIADVEALPDLGDHARYEILSPGVLTISPPPGTTVHQRASYKITNLLDAAAQAAHAGVEILTVVNIEIPGERLATPDVVVADITVSDTDPARLPPPAVSLVVEIVSSSSAAVDRLIKPELYADARLPFYWRLELEPQPALFPYVLRGNRYEELAPVAGGNRSLVPAPFTVQLDPNDLMRR